MDIWMGDEVSAQRYVHSLLQPLPNGLKLNHDPKASAFDPTDFGWVSAPPIAQMNGRTAIVKISGSLVAGHAGFRRLYGAIGYEEIKHALVEAVSRPDVDAVMLFVDSGGGMVKGVQGTAKLIRELKKFKPISAFAVTAASAAYWLASAADDIVAEELSMVGSLGTVIQLINLTDAYAKEGIKFNIFRSGELKMVGGPNEEMSEEAKGYFRQLVEDNTKVFFSELSTNRGIPYDKLRKDYGDGRGVLGMHAKSGGLIDEIGDLGVAMARLAKRIPKKSPIKV